MTNMFPHSNRRGINVALDIVENELALLRDKVQLRQREQEANICKAPKAAPAAQTHKDGQPGHNDSTKRKQVPVPYKETSVLIKRTSRSRLKKTRNQHKRSEKRQERITGTDQKTDSLSCDAVKDDVHSKKDLLKKKEKGRTKISQEQYRLDESVSDDSLYENKHKGEESQGKDSRLYQNQREILQPSRKSKSSSHSVNFAQATLTVRLRKELQKRKKIDEQENAMPFIPCGSKAKSHHVGVLMQQQLGRINNLPPNLVPSLTSSSSLSSTASASKSSDDERKKRGKGKSTCSIENKRRKGKNRSESSKEEEIVTEETVRRALTNIEEYIGQTRSHHL